MRDITMDNKEKLKGLILELFPNLKEEANQAVVEKTEEIANLKASNAELKARLEAIENSPVRKGNVLIPGEKKTVEVMYKKKYLPGQGATLKLYHTPEKQNILAKRYIDFIEKIQRNGQASFKAAMQESTDSEGGYLVFDEYVNELLAFARLNSFALNKCRVIDVGSDRIHIPAENASVSVAWKAEEIAAGASDPTVADVQLDPERLTAYSTVSGELLEDSEIDIVSWLTDLFGEAVGQELDDQVLNGDASATDPFTGILDASCAATDSTGTLNAVHIAAAITALAANKTNGAEFLFHRLIYKDIMTLADTAGQLIFPPSVASPTALWNYPVFMSEKMAYTKTGGLPVGIFGNFKNYIIARRKAAGSLDIDIYGKFLENQVRFRTVSRWHGKPWNCGAFVRLIY